MNRKRDQELRPMPGVALKGESIKDCVLKRTLADDPPALGDTSEDEAVAALAAVLRTRIKQARLGGFSKKSIAGIRRDARKQVGP